MSSKELCKKVELRFRLLEQMNNVSLRIDNILDNTNLDIHQMADLYRYAQTFESLSGAYSKFDTQ